VAVNRLGSNLSSDWSPDGRSLAYVSIRTPIPVDRFSRTLTIREIATRKERDLWPALAYFANPRWSPDGRTILVSGLDLKQRGGIHRVDVETGEVTPALVGAQVGDYEWSADGRSILYRKGSEAIMSHDIASGIDTKLVDFRAMGIERLTARTQPPFSNATTFQLSPDGRSIALAAWKGEGDVATASLEILSLLGSERRIVQVAQRFAFQGWTPRGDLLFTTPVKSTQTPPPVRLWRTSSTGGEPRDMGLEMRGLGGIRINADGTELSFTAGFDGGEVRAMEHAVPR
jgi:dipeptidyl aminopeptidase/acylaminoacyl peptidase